MKKFLLLNLLIAPSVCFSQLSETPFPRYDRVKSDPASQQDEKLKLYIQKEHFYSKMTSGLVLATVSVNVLFFATDLDRQLRAGFVLPVSGVLTAYSYSRKSNYKRKALLRYAKLANRQ